MKFKIDTLVFIILAGKIVQGRIIECRKGERYIEGRNREPQYQEYEVYRISKNDKIRNDYRNINPSHSYKGEYDFSDWFDVNDIYTSVDDALAMLKADVDYIEYPDDEKPDNLVEYPDENQII